MRITMTPVARSPAMMARWMGAAPRHRGSSDACRLRQPWGGTVENGFRQDQAIGRDNRHIGLESAQRRGSLLGAKRSRRDDLDAKPQGRRMNRGGLRFEAAAPARLRRPRIDRRHAMTLFDDLGERGHREIRGPHEDDTQWSGLV